MKKQLRKNLTQNDRLQPQAQTEIFSFGDPIPVLDRADILNYLECSAMYEKW
ncbi:TPA: phage portal protein, partial [Mannheimia haemolytica]|nr:phage portal protein [Mannheimia haemolytica]